MQPTRTSDFGSAVALRAFSLHVLPAFNVSFSIISAVTWDLHRLVRFSTETGCNEMTSYRAFWILCRALSVFFVLVFLFGKNPLSVRPIWSSWHCKQSFCAFSTRTSSFIVYSSLMSRGGLVYWMARGLKTRNLAESSAEDSLRVSKVFLSCKACFACCTQNIP